MGRNGVNAVLKLASLSSLIENYPPDNAELLSFSTVSNLTEMLEQLTVHTADVGLRCVSGVPASIMAFVNMVRNWA